ncbi:uncharacterized protein LOC113294738 [Papaver somniferum]|uniref:uncharacterized protein LOC113294738 n=1 Tax=Papaver somniferum TaxID=3469 RepID=UPI000E704366|nr:uncharacterized protein LOC113294738 [Papaver somniferum]
MEEHVSFKLNNGHSIRFWLDNWSNTGTLRSKYPAIYKVCSRKNASLSDMIVDGRLHCQVRRRLYHYEQLEWDLLCNELGHVHGMNGEADVVEIMGGFSVKKCYDLLVQEDVVCDFSKFLWKNGIPLKVSFLICAIFHDSLRTYAMLSHRGMPFDDVRCSLCKGEEETTDHLMLRCPFEVKVWSYFIKAFQISWVFPDTVKKIFESWRMNNLKGRCKQVWWKVIYAVHWQLWKERNNRALGGRARDTDEVIMLIKQTIVLWFFDRDVFKEITVNQVIFHWETVLHM